MLICSSSCEIQSGKTLRNDVSASVLILHNNAPAHMTRVSKAAICERGFKELPHLAYSPNLAPCDFQLFPNLKCHLKGKQFSSDEELKSTTEDWLNEQDKNFYLKGIEQLCQQYEKYIAVDGDYVEK